MKIKTILALFSCILIFSCSMENDVIIIQDVTPIPEQPAPPPPEPEPKKLTLLVYMAADNDLEGYAIADLKEMEKAVNEDINVLILFDRSEGHDETNDNWTDTRLFELKHDTTNSNFIQSQRISCPQLSLTEDTQTELDMGSYATLSNFIAFARQNYETENYALVVWGHGTGWRYSDVHSRAVAIDDKTDTYMSVKDIGRAVLGKNLDVIGFDTCFGGVFENVYELKDCCEYTVGSANYTPATGWDYKTLLDSLSETDYSPLQISQKMAASAAVCTTVFENERLESVMSALENFSKELAQSVTDNTKRQSVYNTLFSIKAYNYGQYPCDRYIDVYKMAERFSTSSSTAIAQKAAALMTAVNSAGSTTNSTYTETGLFFIPMTAPNTTASAHPSDYVKDSNNTTQCAFIKNSNWWVPTVNGNSGSLLDKLFYADF